jgi:hypothetical protein
MEKHFRHIKCKKDDQMAQFIGASAEGDGAQSYQGNNNFLGQIEALSAKATL